MKDLSVVMHDTGVMVFALLIIGGLAVIAKTFMKLCRKIGYANRDSERNRIEWIVREILDEREIAKKKKGRS